MTKNNFWKLIGLTAVVIGGIIYLVWLNFNHPKGDLIVVESPKAYQKIISPFVVTGRARGTWYFEASFPVRLFDDNGKELVAVPAQAKTDWMTTDFVEFEVELNFTTPTTQKGYIVLEKDNPSGLPEYADELKIPVSF